MPAAALWSPPPRDSGSHERARQEPVPSRHCSRTLRRVLGSVAECMLPTRDQLCTARPRPRPTCGHPRGLAWSRHPRPRPGSASAPGSAPSRAGVPAPGQNSGAGLGGGRLTPARLVAAPLRPSAAARPHLPPPSAGRRGGRGNGTCRDIVVVAEGDALTPEPLALGEPVLAMERTRSRVRRLPALGAREGDRATPASGASPPEEGTRGRRCWGRRCGRQVIGGRHRHGRQTYRKPPGHWVSRPREWHGGGRELSPGLQGRPAC